jgi:transcriptional regulator with XRE-family HTH domain
MIKITHEDKSAGASLRFIRMQMSMTMVETGNLIGMTESVMSRTERGQQALKYVQISELAGAMMFEMDMYNKYFKEFGIIPACYHEAVCNNAKLLSSPWKVYMELRHTFPEHQKEEDLLCERGY